MSLSYTLNIIGKCDHFATLILLQQFVCISVWITTSNLPLETKTYTQRNWRYDRRLINAKMIYRSELGKQKRSERSQYPLCFRWLMFISVLLLLYIYIPVVSWQNNLSGTDSSCYPKYFVLLSDESCSKNFSSGRVAHFYYEEKKVQFPFRLCIN